MTEEDKTQQVEEEQKEESTLETAIQAVIKQAIINQGLLKGLNEVAKGIDRGDARLCFLAKNCDDEKYKRLIVSLCQMHKVPLLEVDSNIDMGRWVGHYKLDKTGEPTKIRRTSSVVISEYGSQTSEMTTILEEIKRRGGA